MPENTLCERPSRDTARVIILGEGSYSVDLPAGRPVPLSELLSSLGISSRSGQLFLDGRPALPGAEVHPDSEAILLPLIRGG